MKKNTEAEREQAELEAMLKIARDYLVDVVTLAILKARSASSLNADRGISSGIDHLEKRLDDRGREFIATLAAGVHKRE